MNARNLTTRRALLSLGVGLLLGALPQALLAQEEADTGEQVHYTLTLVRVELPEEHRFGTGIDREEAVRQVEEDGVRAFAMSLEQMGKASIALQTELESRSGRTASLFAGGEQPFLTTTFGGEDGTQRRTTTQSTVRSGTTVSLEPATVLGGSTNSLMSFRLEHDFAVPTEMDGRTVIGRERLNMTGTFDLAGERGVKVLRTLSANDSGGADESYFILEFERSGGTVLQRLP